MGQRIRPKVSRDYAAGSIDESVGLADGSIGKHLTVVASFDARACIGGKRACGHAAPEAGVDSIGPVRATEAVLDQAARIGGDADRAIPGGGASNHIGARVDDNSVSTVLIGDTIRNIAARGQLETCRLVVAGDTVGHDAILVTKDHTAIRVGHAIGNQTAHRS